MENHERQVSGRRRVASRTITLNKAVFVRPRDAREPWTALARFAGDGVKTEVVMLQGRHGKWVVQVGDRLARALCDTADDPLAQLLCNPDDPDTAGLLAALKLALELSGNFDVVVPQEAPTTQRNSEHPPRTGVVFYDHEHHEILKQPLQPARGLPVFYALRGRWLGPFKASGGATHWDPYVDVCIVGETACMTALDGTVLARCALDEVEGLPAYDGEPDDMVLTDFRAAAQVAARVLHEAALRRL